MEIIQTKQCKQCQASFEITDKDLEFYDKISPVFGWKKYQIPAPTLCPDCRHQRRLTWRNERKLYHRKCSKTDKTIISMFSPDKEYTIYATSQRYADTRDAIEYGRDFDVSKSFFEQFALLLKSVPQISLLGVGNENCDFNNFWWYSKNAYLCFDYARIEDSSYLSRSYSIKNSLDLSYCSECEYSSNLSDCLWCIKCNFSKDLDHCYNCQFCSSCSNCDSCFLCSNLVNKQYHIENKPHTKEEYEKKMETFKSKPHEEIYSDFLLLMQKSIHKYANITNCDRVTGDYLKRCKNCKEVYGAKDTEDSAYVIDPMIVENVYDDVFSGNHCSFNLETVWCEKLSHSKFCFSCRTGSSNLFYCHFCHACNNCFGCVGLRNKEYCILNKQYTKEEYEKEIWKIIWKMIETKERGEFFPISISPFCYNETVVMEYYPLTKNEAEKKWFRWMDQEYAVTVPVETILIETGNVWTLTDEEILKGAIVCEVSGKPFRIIRQELDFYRKHNLPLPTKHPDVRHAERMALRNPRKLRDRKCAKCGAEIKTTYSPERPEIVYCEQCYNKEIY